MAFTLRDYQADAVNGVRTSYQNGKKAPCLVLPTGGGKTIVFSYIAHNSASRGKKVLILVHRVELLNQTVNKLRAFGVRVGLIKSGKAPDYSAPVQVAMVQTMIRRLMYYKHFDLIITDECHHVVSPTYMKILDFYQTYQLGVTATPIRTDGKGLGVEDGGAYDDLVMGPSVRDLIDRGFLVEPVVYASVESIDLTGVKRTKKGDYSQKQLGAAMDKKSLYGNAVKHYMDICRGDPAVAFCASIQHAENVAADFRANGFKFYALSGKTDAAQRDRLIKGLGDGDIHGITSCDVISEGMDIPAIACAILLRPTDSEGLYLQQVGRALRPSPGKDKAIVLDHAGNTMRHGFVDEDREWSLIGKGGSSRKKKDEEAEEKVVQCEKCYGCFRPIEKLCPMCGHERKIKSRELDEVDGELQELTAVDKARMQRERQKMIHEARGLEALQIVGQKLGHKNGWAKHVQNYRDKKAAEKKAAAETKPHELNNLFNQ